MFVYWKPAVQPLLAAVRPKTIVEIGARYGTTTVPLLEFAADFDSVIHSMDPRPDPTFDVAGLEERHRDRFVFHRAKSLDALPTVESIDAVLVDGDHNWYTVYHELQLIENGATAEGRPFPLVLLHDVDWPYGRRDHYPDVEAIPPDHRQPYSRGGAVLGKAELSETSGMRVDTNKAVREGGPRNGVRTAVEDFLEETELELRFTSIAGFAGLGILVPVAAVETNEQLRRALGELESPAWLSDHCRRIEQARLRAVARLAALERASRD